MNLIQYISFSVDNAIEMLMDENISKMDVALFLMNFKKILNKPEKKIIDGEFSEVEVKGIEEGVDRMSISEQVKELRTIANNLTIGHNMPISLAIERFREAADTIESLSAKLQAANMERAAENCGGWIPCSERLPEESLNSVIGWDECRKRPCFVQYIGGRWVLGNDSDVVNIIAWRPLPKPYHEP